jgi:hypothetical protein
MVVAQALPSLPEVEELQLLRYQSDRSAIS